MMVESDELHVDDESTWGQVMMMVVKDMLVHDECKNCHEETSGGRGGGGGSVDPRSITGNGQSS